ncbi:MAG TPA: DNA-primase RepB domain-containing protein [Terriglobales bacterium]|jgi:hypothetical protein|nr:DNA-primase RepB domain-containing protein [Terriglobales bacterium]
MQLPRPRIATDVAVHFLTRSFAREETIALLILRDSPGKTFQRIVLLERVLRPRYLCWLAHENLSGANIHVGANPLRPDSRKRTKESVATVRHLYLDLDCDGETRIAALRASDAVPTPNAIVATSRGKYQILWRVKGFTIGHQESTLKVLALAFGGDPACTDCNRVLRLPGFLNSKYDPAHQVTVEYPCESTWSPEDFRLDISASEPRISSRSLPPRQRSAKRTNSEQDWAWVLHELAHGKDAVKITRTLAARRMDKPNPLYYAQRTVDLASARLWLIEGVSMDDVATMLEVRRRFETPIALSRVRAREIAETAQRMIARKKIA